MGGLAEVLAVCGELLVHWFTTFQIQRFLVRSLFFKLPEATSPI